MLISRNLGGWRIGVSHHKAKLTDSQVREMRRQREQNGRSYGWLAKRFECGESTVRDIVKYRTRYNA